MHTTPAYFFLFFIFYFWISKNLSARGRVPKKKITKPLFQKKKKKKVTAVWEGFKTTKKKGGGNGVVNPRRATTRFLL